jgi:magnesium chelatase family protein
MDRIDLVLDVSRVDPRLILDPRGGEDSATMRERVSTVRDRAEQRDLGPTAQLAGGALLEACALETSARRALETVARTQHLSGRGVTRLLRVARTVADLEGCDSVCAEHLAEVVGFRAKGDR